MTFTRAGILAKAAATLMLVAAADLLFFDAEPGASLGLFALACIAALAITRPAVLRTSAPRIALIAATAYALVLIDDPSPLAALLFAVAVSLATLLPRRRFDDAWRWAMRLVAHGVTGAAALPIDLTRVRAHRRRHAGRGLLSLVALPAIGAILFVSLFAAANPIIGRWLDAIRWPALDEASVGRLILWAVVAILAWLSLRPRAIATRLGGPVIGVGRFVLGVSPQSVTLSLITFNLIFAVANGLDLAYLWSGAALPPGVTLADYAHRGAYPLIVTALLAGLFVIVTLRPGSDTARAPVARRLVTIWIAQNIFLVASSILRTLDYVDAYSLTILRIAALAWMALVAAGLVLICWRMLAEKSASWLINRNATAAAIVLSLASVVDLGAVAAQWNVRHAREIDGTGARLDLCYLARQGPSALLPLIELEGRVRDPMRRDRIVAVRAGALDDLRLSQTWHGGWTWRGARRLRAAEAALGPMPARPRLAPFGRDCDGAVRPPPAPPPPPIAAPRLTEPRE